MEEKEKIALAIKMIEEYERGTKLKDLAKLFNIGPSFLPTMLEKNLSLAARYSRAQLYRAESLADEIIHISDTEQDYGKARNQIDARKWYASKIMPAKYGDRIDVNVTQTVDIGAALEAAKRRISLPIVDLANEPLPQAIDILEISHVDDTGSTPVLEALDKLPDDIL